MLTPRTIDSLNDIKRQCLLIAEFIGDRSVEDYLTDEYFRSAIERKIEVIGVAAISIRDNDPATYEKLESLRYAIGVRNRLAHGYDELINNAQIWEVAFNSIPRLAREIDQFREHTG